MYTVAIVGNVGVGKSSLLRAVRELRPGWRVRTEELRGNPYLTRLRVEPSRWATLNQLAFLTMRFAQAEKECHAPVVLIERCIEEDFNVFVPYSCQQGWVGDDERRVLLKCYQDVMAAVPAPQMYVYLETDVRTQLTRIAERGGQGDNGISTEMLHELHCLYHRWLTKMPRASVVRYCTSYETPDEIAVELVKLIETTVDIGSQTACSPGGVPLNTHQSNPLAAVP